ncbi:tetraacyldisaccharide 4'-kinase [Pelagibacterales bacterium SAG-MED29]|nr:tetraacyldisaccharide 4'-kinase [Pelagibacterales bacterium SAG-MED29]
MKILKPKFWEKNNNLISLLLLPISFLLQILIIIKKKLTFEHSFKIPVICIGNIYLGGTGKTPLTIFIAKELRKHNKKPAIIKKYYSEHIDEHNLIDSSLDCLFLNKQRSKAINIAKKEQYDVAILDDGFQDYSIKKNLNILCFNSNQLIGNGMTLPAGPLRENMNAIKRTQIVLINGSKNQLFEEKILSISNKVKIFYSKYLPENIEEFRNKNLFAFAGIGNPSNFFKLLGDNNLNVQTKLAFPDHYKFSKSEIQKIVDESFKNNLELVTTEKDYFRIKHYGFKNIKFLKIKLEILEKDKLINQILNYT